MRTWLNIESRAIKVLSSHTERQGQESIYTVRDYTVECSRYEYTAIPIHIWGGGGEQLQKFAARKLLSDLPVFICTHVNLKFLGNASSS